jgi:hypothetical protein
MVDLAWHKKIVFCHSIEQIFGWRAEFYFIAGLLSKEENRPIEFGRIIFRIANLFLGKTMEK